MYDLERTSAAQQQGVAATPIAVFALELGHYIIPTYLALHYCHSTYPYSREAAVPFFSAPAHHLIALHANGMLGATDDRRIVLGQVLLIPTVKLTSHVGATAADTPTRYIPWNDWGSIGTRRVPDPISQGYFQNALSGSRFIPRPHTGDLVDIWDFGVAPERCDHESLPCVQKQLALPSHITGRVVAMLSEDAIVICEARSLYRSADLCSLPPSVTCE
jgi:hypothetical protein